jgi:hypothetical protein
MNKILILIITVQFFFLNCNAVLAATYYVATNGDNSYSKAEAQNVDTPWRTLNYAESQLSSGDTVIVRGGTYYEQLYIEVPDVAFKAYPGETPILNGDVSGDGWPFDIPTWDGLITVRHVSGVTIDGFRTINSKKGGINTWGTASHVTIKNCETYYTGGNGITIAANYSLVENNDVSYSNLNTVSTVCPGGLGSSTGWGAALTTSTGANIGIIIRGNIVSKSCGEGISAIWRSDDVLVEDNIAYDHRSVNYYLDTSNNVTFRNNIGYCTGDSDWFRTNGWNRAGINLAIDNERTFAGYQGGDHRVYNNLFADCAYGIIMAHWGSSPNPVDNVEIYNNIIVESYNSNNNDIAFSITDDGHTNIKVRNNIIVNTAGTLASVAPTGVMFSNNLWWDGRGGMPEVDARGTGDVYANPNLVKTSNWNNIIGGTEDAAWWEIMSGSPAIDAGVALGSPYNVDFAKVTRPQDSGWDIGAYEYTSTTPTCGEGQITSLCICSGTEYSSGYCCSGSWQSTACSAPTSTASAYRFTGPVTLDGDLTEWQNVPSLSLITPDDVVTGSSSSNNDASLIFKALWDSDNIYIAADVTDDVITSDDPTQGWRDDSVEVYFDGNHDSTGPTQPDDFRPRLFPDGTWEDDLTAGKSATLAAQSKPGGYILEAIIPYSSLGNIIPAADKILGFDLQMNDDDDGGSNDAVLMFSGDPQGGNFAGLVDLILESSLVDITPPPYHTVLKTSSPPVIDGDISEFSGLDVITLSNSQGTTGDYKLMWDDTALYIAASVTDTQLNADSTHVEDSPLWRDDSIELMFDTLHNAGTTLQNDDYKFFVNIQNVHTDSLAFDMSWNASYTSDVQLSGTVNDNTDTDTGYTIEIAMPWSNWGISPPATNDAWGFELVMNDRNSSGLRDWSPWANTDQDGNPNNPDGWGDLWFLHPSDSNQDGCINLDELLAFIDRWKKSSKDVPMPEVMEAIGLWNSGTGC